MTSRAAVKSKPPPPLQPFSMFLLTTAQRYSSSGAVVTSPPKIQTMNRPLQLENSVKMSHKRGTMSQKMESVWLSVNAHMSSVGEELLCVLDKQQQSGGADVKLRVFVLERLSAAAEYMCNLFQREMETEKTRNKLLDAMLQPHIKLHRTDFLHLPVWERSPIPVQEEPEHPQIKEEQPETLQRPVEAAGSTLTLLAMKRGDDEDGKTEPLASTSTEHMTTQADVENSGASQPTIDDQLLSSHGSDSDTDDSDDWDENGADQSAFSTLKSHTPQQLEGQRLSLSNELSQDLTSSKQTTSTRSHTGTKSLICTVCGKRWRHVCQLKIHMRTHTGEKPFTCTVCEKRFHSKTTLNTHMWIHTCTICGARIGNVREHMKTHTGTTHFTCTVCEESFSRRHCMRRHMETHTACQGQDRGKTQLVSWNSAGTTTGSRPRVLVLKKQQAMEMTQTEPTVTSPEPD